MKIPIPLDVDITRRYLADLIADLASRDLSIRKLHLTRRQTLDVCWEGQLILGAETVSVDGKQLIPVEWNASESFADVK